MWDGYEDNEWYEENDWEIDQNKSSLPPVKFLSLEIFKLIKALSGSLDEARKALYGQHLCGNAKCIISHYLQTEQTDDFILKMESAVMIKLSVRQILDFLEVLEKEQTHPTEHFVFLKSTITTFKEEFVLWVKSFDPHKKSPDGWGIFE
jgi:hypothetical protein